MAGKYHFGKSTAENTRSGYTTNVYIADKADMLAIQEPAANPATPADKFKITTDHTFAVATPVKGFVKGYTLPKRGEADHTSSGEEGALSSNYKHKIFIPGDGAKLQALIEDIKSAELIMIVEDASAEGVNIQYGSKRISAHVSSYKFTSGNQMEGTKGWELEITASDRFFYSGAITLQGT